MGWVLVQKSKTPKPIVRATNANAIRNRNVIMSAKGNHLSIRVSALSYAIGYMRFDTDDTFLNTCMR